MTALPARPRLDPALDPGAALHESSLFPGSPSQATKPDSVPSHGRASFYSASAGVAGDPQTLHLLALFGGEPGAAAAPLRLRPRKSIAALTAAVAMCLSAPAAGAQQLEFQRAPVDATLEAYANLTAAYPTDTGHERAGLRADGAVRALGLVDVAQGLQLGARGVLGGAAYRGGSDGSLIERSVLVAGDFGRFEYGRRMGLPDVLTGYAPNPYTFTTAEYGPHSGPNLDPGGTLPTKFLPRALARQIDAVSVLGVSAARFDDISDKFLYVSPKHAGFLGAAAYAPHVTASDDRRDLVQTALVHETYADQNVYRVGGSYAYSGGKNGAGALHSLSLGASAVLDDAWEVGGSATYGGATALRQPAAAGAARAAYGLAASLNYNRGAWTFGGYTQWARAADDAGSAGGDILRAASVGGSYRPSTWLRFYSAFYGYSFDDGGAPRSRGTVWLAGARASI